jgi:hypothetical protein
MIMTATDTRGQTAEEFASFVADGRAAAMFVAAALDDEIWERACANPRRYFEARGVMVPRSVTSRFVDRSRPDPESEATADLVTVRCWWVTARNDDDESDPPQPVRFCLEVPAEAASRFERLRQ